jgi:hypothetical protein
MVFKQYWTRKTYRALEELEKPVLVLVICG